MKLRALKSGPILSLLTACIVLLSCAAAFATTFTNNTSLVSGNTNYDGTDIVVSNCTLTVDGLHTFSSMHVTSGGVLTHSFAPSGTVPAFLFVTNESQFLSGANQVALLNSNVIASTVFVTDSTGMTNYINNVDYLLSSPDGVTTDLQRTTNSSIPDGATVLVSYETQLGTTPGGLTLSITGNVQVDAGGAIKANGLGYANGLGSGAGRSAGFPLDGSGGGYGGNGGTSSSNALGGGTYGSFYQPASLGSSGGTSYLGSGGAGGGLIEITAGGTVIVNGSISANGGNGTNSRSGGGSGGSVWITCVNIFGTGAITANGGNGEPTHGGGGSGGRVAAQGGATDFSGTMTAYGGAGANIGGAGTIYTKVTGLNGTLLFDNDGQFGTNSPATVSDNTVNIMVQGEASVVPSGSWTIGALTVASNGLIVAGSSGTVSVNASGAVTIAAGGGILANAAGSGAGLGSGAGHSYNDQLYRPCGGGGYGGAGASGTNILAIGGNFYGTQFSPSGLGSGGGTLPPYSTGGSGGGSIQITSVNGIVQVDGTIAANGGNGSGSGGGGGSGGTIVLTGGTLLGSGAMTANGGNGANAIGGGGGGGRISIASTANLFAGTVSAYGGGGGNWGGAGTVLFPVSSGISQLILDNNGHAGPPTYLQTENSATDLIVRNGAIGSSSFTVTFDDLYLSSNGWLVAPPNPGTLPVALTASLTGNATIGPGCGIVADLAGYSAGNGPGAGHSTAVNATNFCSGASHGGYGGSSFGNYATSAAVYDTATSPSQGGSGGGTTQYELGLAGGAGGGIVHLTVSGTLELDGLISANGGSGSGSVLGGGSGGSIYISAATLTGNGSVAANGGGGAGNGGGGGGGMAYITCNNNSLSGPITAYGGGGANWGGEGTTFIQVSGKNSQLILDGGGHSGPATPLTSSSTTDITVRNAAVAMTSPGGFFGNLLISSNGWLTVSNASFFSALTFSTATIQSGGGIIGDSGGSTAGNGAGPGHSYASSPSFPCSGAGHGGNGGGSLSNLAVGGIAYDSPLAPSSYGSGGGTDLPYSIGGAGGAGFRLNVTGLLQLDGLISANGGNGSGTGGGGGSGGSIYIVAGTLAGGGAIIANGGNGANLIGGGGSGGCIALYPTVNQFTGTMAAYGGSGAQWGGAGTIYAQTNGGGQITIDNGGQAGAGTPIPSESSSTGLILRNGAIGLPAFSATLGNLLIASNATLLVSNAGSYTTLTLASATIQSGGRISADVGGYASASGNGAGHSSSSSPAYACGGAAHGGNGGSSAGNAAAGGAAYDSQTSPALVGSGGGAYLPNSTGGTGGGGLHFTVTGLMQIDGSLSANGGSGSGAGGGGGSGGGIYITAGTLAGGGSIAANGGSGANTNGGGGGGGIIAIYPTVNQFSGAITAYGGGGANWGGAGTIYIQTNGIGQITVDNGNEPGATTPLQSLSSSTGLILRNGAVGLPPLSASWGTVLIASNGWLMVSNSPGSFATLGFSSATIQAGGGIIADDNGYAGGQGSGHGSFVVNALTYCSGAGHGGNGGNASGLAAGGAPYDSESSPDAVGSGGGSEGVDFGGPGGGGFRLTVSGLLQVDGIISANGGNGLIAGGGGSGGGIYLSVGTLSGGGSITANGGSGAGGLAGGGAGGCIAVYSTVNQFSGLISAYGGSGAQWGGAGTIYYQTAQPSITYQLIIDNGGQSGATTPIQSVTSSAGIVLRNAAAGYQQTTSQTFASFLIYSNALLLGSNSGVNLTITGNATIQSGGGIVTDAGGSAAGLGIGSGRFNGSGPNYPCSGSGYGGVGGAGFGNLAAGGIAYGSITSPSATGSGGGTDPTYSFGGAGGGSIKLTVNGVLDAEGRISANGGNGYGIGGGGGSGGSVWLTIGTLVGAGSITANGGSGADAIGGGGGGGRIAVTTTASAFLGSMTAYGGAGYAYGGAGTIYTKNGQAPGQLILQNGGSTGPSTPLSSNFGLPSLYNVTIGTGASVFAQAGIPLMNNLTIASGGQLTASANQTTMDLLVTGNVNVQSGGAIVLDGQGYAEASGPGAGQSFNEDGSGAGYGGVGGASATVAGGIAYGSSNQPVDFGSGGGYGYGTLIGGSVGGGALRLTVGGNLNVDGQISANGQAGLQDNSGGGSGGSIWATAGAFSGTGLITASGGEGELYGGGGGAGGRIALYARTNIYSGLVTVPGAEGDFLGATGTIYSNNVPALQVLSNSPNGIVNNGVSSVILYFNDAPYPNLLSASAVSLTTPNGPLAGNLLSFSMLSSAVYQVSFPLQTAVGNYVVTVASNFDDLFGQPMAQTYTGGFSISLPVIQGTVTDTNGQPIAGVLMQASGGLSSTTTDTNGNYSLGFVPGASFTVTPSLGALVFVPPSMSYTSVSASVTNQNYLGVSSIVPVLTAANNGNSIILNWQGILGVNYQIMSSTNLMNWIPYGPPMTGSNAPIQISVPTSLGLVEYFDLESSN